MLDVSSRNAMDVREWLKASVPPYNDSEFRTSESSHGGPELGPLAHLVGHPETGALSTVKRRWLRCSKSEAKIYFTEPRLLV